MKSFTFNPNLLPPRLYARYTSDPSVRQSVAYVGGLKAKRGGMQTAQEVIDLVDWLVGKADEAAAYNRRQGARYRRRKITGVRRGPWGGVA